MWYCPQWYYVSLSRYILKWLLNRFKHKNLTNLSIDPIKLVSIVWSTCQWVPCVPSADCEQVEHSIDRADDVFPWGCCEHTGAAGPAGEVWKQDPDTYQDRPQLQNAFAFPSCGVLHTQGAGWPGDVVYGSRPHPAVWSQVEQTDWCRHHSFPLWHESRRGSAHPQLVQVSSLVRLGSSQTMPDWLWTALHTMQAARLRQVVSDNARLTQTLHQWDVHICTLRSGLLQHPSKLTRYFLGKDGLVPQTILMA